MVGINFVFEVIHISVILISNKGMSEDLLGIVREEKVVGIMTVLLRLEGLLQSSFYSRELRLESLIQTFIILLTAGVNWTV